MSRYIDADDVLTQRKPLKWDNIYEQGKVEGWNNAIDYIGNFAPSVSKEKAQLIDKSALGLTDMDTGRCRRIFRRRAGAS